MGRKRVTQLFPWLLPLRKWERKVWFYGKMRFDGETYAEDWQEERLKYLCFSSETEIINRDSGFDIKYQENKEHNLRLACKTLDGVLIRPGETFSFWQLVRHAEDGEPYREGLSMVDGAVEFTKGGGLCQLSNDLFWCFLHTPLIIAERHTHRVQNFSALADGRPAGTDAAVSEGWLDLKIQNNSSTTYQLGAGVVDGRLACEIRCNRPVWEEYEIFARDVQYVPDDDEIWQRARLYRRVWDIRQPERPKLEHWLYENRTRIRPMAD
ncbi:MAG: VanW family protein [Firmicutes bacterium]|nr:VanW family protein [Bacillota bacterium]